MTLIDRLSKLEGPDREVDAQIYIQFNIPAERAGRIDYAHGMVGWWPKDGPYVSAVTVPAYTASVDEAIALAERVLPGWHWSIYDTDGVGRCNAQMERPDFTGAEDFDGTGATPAIALCIALLRAKEASNVL